MSLLELSIVSAAGIKAVMFLMYLFLFLHYREDFLGYWTFAWALIFLKSAIDPFVLNADYFYSSFILLQLTVMLSVISLSWGTWCFVGKKLPKFWIASAAVLSITSSISIFYTKSLVIALIPNIIMFGLIHIHTGLILLSSLDTQGLAKKITAYAFILNGIHQFDFPLFRPSEVAHWGYLLDAFLRLVISISFLLTYFEKTRSDLSKKEAQFRLMADNAKDIIYRYQFWPYPQFEYISPSVAEITGYTPSEFYADNSLIFRITCREDRHLLQGFEQTMSSTVVPICFRIMTKSNIQVWVEQHAVPIYDQENRLIAVEGIIRDVTGRKQLEQELYRLDRLNLIGQMAANLGHEVRNPLTTVRGYLQLLNCKKDLEPYHRKIEFVISELDRANSLISEYLALAKNRLTDQKLVSINGIIESLYPLIQANAASTNHIVNLDLQEVPELLLDEKEIRQLILNLVRNGIEAMSPGKTLTIKTYYEKEDLILAVQDEGKGIPAELLDKIGLPFFTTKEAGTGLGLAICYSIANRHFAKIEVESSKGGTTFYTRFKLKKAV